MIQEEGTGWNLTGDYVRDVAVMVGGAVDVDGGFRAQAGAGLGLARGDRGEAVTCPPTVSGPCIEQRTFSNEVGLALEGQLYKGLGSHFGLGMYAYGNVNDKESFGGAAVSFNLVWR